MSEGPGVAPIAVHVDPSIVRPPVVESCCRKRGRARAGFSLPVFAGCEVESIGFVSIRTRWKLDRATRFSGGAAVSNAVTLRFPASARRADRGADACRFPFDCNGRRASRECRTHCANRSASRSTPNEMSPHSERVASSGSIVTRRLRARNRKAHVRRTDYFLLILRAGRPGGRDPFGSPENTRKRCHSRSAVGDRAGNSLGLTANRYRRIRAEQLGFATRIRPPPRLEPPQPQPQPQPQPV